jgi:hypothetical protein
LKNPNKKVTPTFLISNLIKHQKTSQTFLIKGTVEGLSPEIKQN